MDYLEKWLKRIIKCKTYTEKLKELSEKQNRLLEEDDIDGIIKGLEEKEDLLAKINEENYQISIIREKCESEVFSEEAKEKISQIRKLQEESARNIEKALARMTKQENELSSKRMKKDHQKGFGEGEKLETDFQINNADSAAKAARLYKKKKDVRESGQGGVYFDKKN